MTNRSIYDAALRLVSEVDLPSTNADYEERAQYLLPVVCHGFAALDRALRASTDRTSQVFPTDAVYQLDGSFPLSDAFLSPASALLASMLVIEENPELSDRLERMSRNMTDSLRASIPFSLETIVNRYS